MVVLLIIALPVSCFAGSPVDVLKSFLGSAGSLTADFSQVTVDETGNQDQQSKGVFSLQRPGKFRWDYKQPYQQEIISNGDKVWFFDADLEQVTVKRLDAAIGSTPALLLSGEMTLDDNFILIEQDDKDGLRWIKLLPKTEASSFTSIVLGLDESALKRMELSDKFGQTTRISFSNIKTNHRLDAATFQFDPPKGVDVFEE